MAHPLSPLECAQDALMNMLADFRAWLHYETLHEKAWKHRPLNEAIAGVKSSMIDDVESMIEAYRKNQNKDVEGGGTAFIPVMFIATAVAAQPPEISQIIGIPYWLDVIVNDGVEDKIVQMRIIPKAIRAQIAYVSTNPHGTGSVSDQFIAYMSDDAKRRIPVFYNGLKDPFEMTILDNTLFPDIVATEAKNVSIISIDFTLIGGVPQIPNPDTDNGYNTENGDMGGTNGGQRPFQVVTTADQKDEDTGQHLQVNADPDTGEITVTEIIDP